MRDRLEKIRLVILECPYDSWGHPETEKMFGRMVGLKLRGYGAEYPYGVMAMDTADMISDHLLICEERETGLHPLMGNRSVPLRKCEQHHLGFPALTILEESGAHEQAEVVREIIEDAKTKGIDLRYAGSGTLDPSERGNKEWSMIMRDIFTTMYTSYYRSLSNVGVFTGGTCRFKMDKYVCWMGHKPIEKNGIILDPVNVSHLYGEKVLWTYLREFSLEARQVTRTYQKLWEERLHIKADKSYFTTLRKAA